FLFRNCNFYKIKVSHLMLSPFGLITNYPYYSIVLDVVSFRRFYLFMIFANFFQNGGSKDKLGSILIEK
ncbi:MAG: hypothetical protein MUP24_07840, partial [Gillisia sp.]|nr:hypothetical protein [Gillisia sp.]